jgi:hypothetical protein
MNAAPHPHFLLLLRHGGTPPPPAELAQIMAKFKTWMDGIKARGEFVATNGLEFTGKVLRTGGVVSDGPFIEAKEMVGGYIVITARDLDHAVEIARGCPGLQRPGTNVEVRPIVSRPSA